MSICKGCGAKIDWIRTKDGRYMPVEPEPVFIVEGDCFGRYVTDEGEVISGRRALLSEQNTLCEVAFIPHDLTLRILELRKSKEQLKASLADS